jgi:hypothetical protein
MRLGRVAAVVLVGCAAHASLASPAASGSTGGGSPSGMRASLLATPRGAPRAAHVGLTHTGRVDPIVDAVVPLPVTGAVDLAVDPTSGRVLVTGGDTVFVFAAGGSLVASLGGLGRPRGAVVVGGVAHVADAAGGRIVLIDVASARVSGSVALAPGSTPGDLVWSGGRLWFGDDGGNLVGVDPVTGTQLDAAPTGRTAPLRLVGDDRTPGRVFVLDALGGSVWSTASSPPTLASSGLACGGGFVHGAASAAAVHPGGGAFLRASIDAPPVATDADGVCTSGDPYVAPPTVALAATAAAGGLVAASGTGLHPLVALFALGAPNAFRSFALPAGTQPPRHMAFSPDGTVLYGLSDAPSGPGLVVARTIDTGIPTLVDVDPPYASSLGGNRVTIRGTNLLSAYEVTIGGVLGADLVVRSSSEVDVTVPALEPGVRPVVVRNSIGASVPTADAFVLVSRELGGLGEFTPAGPVRLLDTRDGTGVGASGAVPGGGEVALRVLGVAGVPVDGVAAVVLNVTVTDPTSPGYLTVYPTGAARPLASNLNFERGRTVPNLVVARVGPGGGVSLFNSSGSTHVIADLAGWFSAADGPRGSRFHPIAPVRVIDTREGDSGPLPGRWSLWFDLMSGAPADAPPARAWVLNVTATEATAATFVTAYPWGAGAPPVVSNLNVARGQTVANLVVVSGSGLRGGVVALYNNAGAVHLVVDVVGWFDGEGFIEAGRFVPLDAPVRRFDTREAASVVGGSTLDVTVAGWGGVPHADYVDGVVANVTATDATAPTYVTVHPVGVARPLASSLNLGVGATVPNLVFARTGDDGGVAFFNAFGRTQLIADVIGWFTSPLGAFGLP